jgi:hypothetical protein
MLYAITIEPLNAVYFVTDRPDDNPWEVLEGVELDVNPLFGTWTPDRGPLHQTLCVSTSDPQYFKVFQHAEDIGVKGFRPTGRRFGGLYSKATWERIMRHAPGIIAALCIEDDEPSADIEQAFATIEQGG